MSLTARRTLILASTLFLISGATGLAYEVIWFKRFSHLWGGSSLAMAAVVASFLFGLGVGANVIGRWADRVSQPLRWYGVAEIVIGGLALFVPFEIALLAPISATIERGLPDVETPRLIVRFLLTLVVLGPPCFLMGGTLPLLVRQCTARALTEATGWLYGINTLGAALGCYLAGFHLLPLLGLYWANIAAATTNFIIGLVAVVVAKQIPIASAAGGAVVASVEPVEQAVEPTSAWRHWAVLFAAALSGIGALMLQITWARYLAVALGGSTYAFSATLFIVLVGIALGGMLYHFVLRRAPSPELVVAAIVLVLALSTAGSRLLLPALCRWVGGQAAIRATLLGNAWVCVAASAVLELVPSLMAGALFPLLVQLTRESAARVGRTVGDIYAWNTLGSIIGASLTALVCFPRIGTAGAMCLGLAAYVLLALLALPTQRRKLALAVACVAGTGGGAALALWPQDPRLTNSGLYIYGRFEPRQLMASKALYFREGTSCDVLVTEDDGNRSLRVNGKADASSSGDMGTQVGLAYFPRAFVPRAKDVLAIGFGSGVTVGDSVAFPDTRVTCCEIEPAVFKAGPYFARENHEPWKSPNLKMVFDDGRSYLERSQQQFDLIISEPSNPWLAGVSGLFTEEFFKIVRSRLRPGGVLGQWIQTYNFSLSEYALIVRTLKKVFPHQALVALTAGYDTVLLASDRPLAPTLETLNEYQAIIDATPTLRTDLETMFLTKNFKYLMLNYFVGDDAGVDRLIADERSQTINTDINLRLEYEAPLRLYDPTYREENLLAKRLEQIRDGGEMTKLANQLKLGEDSPEHQLVVGKQALAEGKFQQAIEHFQRAYGGDPDLLEAGYDLATAYSKSKQILPAIEIIGPLLERQPENSEARNSYAQLLILAKRYSEAAAHYRELLRRRPGSTGAKTNLAWLLATAPDAQIRNGEEAVRLAEEVNNRFFYRDGSALDVLAAALAETGDFERAAHVASQAAGRLMNEGKPTDGIQQRIALYNARRPFRSP